LIAFVIVLEGGDEARVDHHGAVGRREGVASRVLHEREGEVEQLRVHPLRHQAPADAIDVGQGPAHPWTFGVGMQYSARCWLDLAADVGWDLHGGFSVAMVPVVRF
jgi:hypothetical protein